MHSTETAVTRNCVKGVVRMNQESGGLRQRSDARAGSVTLSGPPGAWWTWFPNPWSTKGVYTVGTVPGADIHMGLVMPLLWDRPARSHSHV